ncbi:hypothetical protein CYMTET_47032, partial [Cymbomonas tetramitiformis]
FYEPQQGVVLLDGTEVKLLDHHWLHRNVGLVGQEPVLFRCSVEENILYSRRSVTRADVVASDLAELEGEPAPLQLDPKVQVHVQGGTDDDEDDAKRRLEDVVRAARVANAHDFVSALPQGYQTEVGERGIQMSGGQKQRIAIARAVLQDPRVLLLDEATSALDTESEAVVQEALERAMQNRSVLVIAHRLSTVSQADCICVLDHGRVTEQGTQEELLAKSDLSDKIPDSGVSVPMTYRMLIARQKGMERDIA